MHPDTAFAFFADPRNIARCLPMIKDITRTGREDLLVQLDLAGVMVVQQVWLRVYRDRRQLAWGTPNNDVVGALHVLWPREGGSAAPDGCLVVLKIETGDALSPTARRFVDDALARLRSAARAPAVALG